MDGAVEVFTRVHTQLQTSATYETLADLLCQLMASLSSLLDIEDRLFVNRFPYRAQVFSFTEELVTKFRRQRSLSGSTVLISSLSEVKTGPF